MKTPRTTQPSKVQTAIKLKHQSPAPVTKTTVDQVQKNVGGKGAPVLPVVPK